MDRSLPTNSQAIEGNLTSESYYSSEEELQSTNRDVIVLYVHNDSIQSILADKLSSKELCNSYNCSSLQNNASPLKIGQKNTHSHIVVNLKLLKELQKQNSKDLVKNQPVRNFVRKLEKLYPSKELDERCQQNEAAYKLRVQNKLDAIKKNNLKTDPPVKNSHIKLVRKKFDQIDKESEEKKNVKANTAIPKRQDKIVKGDNLKLEAAKELENQPKEKLTVSIPQPVTESRKQHVFAKFSGYMKTHFSGKKSDSSKKRSKSRANSSEDRLDSESIYEDERIIKCCKYIPSCISETRTLRNEEFLQNSTIENFRHLKSLEKILSIYKSLKSNAKLQRSSAGESQYIVDSKKRENKKSTLKPSIKNDEYQNDLKQSVFKTENFQLSNKSKAKHISFEQTKRNDRIYESSDENVYNNYKIRNRKIHKSDSHKTKWQPTGPSSSSEYDSENLENDFEYTEAKINRRHRVTVGARSFHKNDRKKRLASQSRKNRSEHCEWVVRKVKSTSSEKSLSEISIIPRKDASYILGRYKFPPPVPYYKKNYIVQKVRKFKNRK